MGEQNALSPRKKTPCSSKHVGRCLAHGKRAFITATLMTTYMLEIVNAESLGVPFLITIKKPLVLFLSSRLASTCLHGAFCSGYRRYTRKRSSDPAGAQQRNAWAPASVFLDLDQPSCFQLIESATECMSRQFVTFAFAIGPCDSSASPFASASIRQQRRHRQRRSSR